MCKHDIKKFVIAKSSTLLNAINAIEKNKNRGVLVVEGTKVVGIVSEGDILRALQQGMDVHAMVDSIIQLSFKYLLNKNMREAFEYFKKYNITILPVVEPDMSLVDIITLPDLLEHVIINTQ